jgi:hypothetical protein
MDRFSKFNPQTNISGQEFDELEQICGLTLDDERRAAIIACLREFEFFRAYERSGAARRRWKAFLEIKDHLEAIIRAAKAEETLPGHLWSLVTDNAGVNGQTEIERLERVRAQLEALESNVREARKNPREVDPWLPQLLFGLEQEIRLAGAKKTGVANADGKRRGKFVKFCDAALKHVPEPYRPRRSIGSRWETLYTQRKSGNRPPTTKNWVGKAIPALRHY